MYIQSIPLASYAKKKYVKRINSPFFFLLEKWDSDISNNRDPLSVVENILPHISKILLLNNASVICTILYKALSVSNLTTFITFYWYQVSTKTLPT